MAERDPELSSDDRRHPYERCPTQTPSELHDNPEAQAGPGWGVLLVGVFAAIVILLLWRYLILSLWRQLS